MATKTTNLGILLIQPTDYFADESFNKIINDIDKKVVGIVHLLNKGHWDTWKKNKNYTKGDVLRIANTKSNQYYMCITGGTSGNKEPTNNVAGSIVTDGLVKWKVCEIGGGGGTTTAGVQLWLAGHDYSIGDIVLYDNAFYRCKAEHTADSTFALDSDKFTTLCAELRIWKKGIFYHTNDIVVYENNLYVCNVSHTSQTDFTLDVAKWDSISSSSLVYEHEINHTYMKGELSTVNNRLYRCNVMHISSDKGFSHDVSNWDLISAQIPAWKTATYYSAGDIIQINDVMYKCVSSHTSTTGIIADKVHWTPFPKSTAYIQDWKSNTSYEPNQVVVYQGKLFRCVTANNDTNFTDTNWEKLGGDLSLWETNTTYVSGDIIIHNKKLYRCTISHTSNDFNNEISNWEEISATRIFNWSTYTPYVIGDLVVVNNRIYRCIHDHTSIVFSQEISHWELISSSSFQWVSQSPYQVGDLIVVDGKLYYCNTAHISTTDINTDMVNWTLLNQVTIEDWESNTGYAKNQLITLDGTLFRANISHTSTNLDMSKWDNIYAQIQSYGSRKVHKSGELVIYDNKIWRARKDIKANVFQYSHSVNNLKLLYYSSYVAKTGNYNLNTPLEAIKDLGSSNYIYKLGLGISSKLNMYWTQIDIYSSLDDINYTFMGTAIINDGLANNVVIDSYVRYIKLVASKYYANATAYNMKGEMFVDSFSIYTKDSWEQLYSESPALLIDWAGNTEYARNALVYYKNLVYRVKKGFTSASQFDTAHLELLNDSYIADWQPDKYYAKNQCVTKDDKLLISISGHISDTTFSSTEEKRWKSISSENSSGGNNGISQWETATKYQEGNVVLKNNTPYISNTNHTSNTFADDFQKWDLTYSNIRDWESDVFYHKGSLVVHNDTIFQANTPHLSVDFDTDIGAVFQTTEPYGYDYTAISPNLVVVFKEEIDLTGFLILQSEKTRTNGASLTTVDVDITDSSNVTKTVKVTVGTKLEVTEKATSIKFKNPVGVNGSVTEYVNQTSLILVYGKDVSCWTSLINPNMITKKQIDALF